MSAETIAGAVAAHLAALERGGYSAATLATRRRHLARFTAWAESRAVRELGQLTPAVLERYREALYAARQRRGANTGRPLSWATQAGLLVAVRAWLAWATTAGYVAVSPAAQLTLPKVPRTLPRAVLSIEETERVLAMPDAATPLGLRDRAILEVLYSTGVRRAELVGLDVADLDPHRRVLLVREGKGKKDRVVPIGHRAIAWVVRYLDRVRTRLLHGHDPGALFLSARGTRIRPTRLTERLHRYVVAAAVGKPGSVHIFRHTMATLMHDAGADIRDLQAMLGHAELATTERYTHVAIPRLQAVHAATHPAEQSPDGGDATRAHPHPRLLL